MTRPGRTLRGALLLAALAQPAAAGEESDVDTENLFGFTEGSSTGRKGEQEILLDTVGRAGKNRGATGPRRYGVASTKLSYQFDPTEALSIEFGLFGDARRVRGAADLPDKDNGSFDGAGIELKYQFLKGSDDQPLGLAVELRPRFARVLPVEGRGANIFDMESVLQLDLRLVPDKVWYGMNVSYEPTVGTLRGSRDTDRSSTFLWSNAVAVRIDADTFVGPELRYLRSHDGAFLNRYEGRALTLGPLLYRRLSDKAFVTLAYAGQIAGRDRTEGQTRRPLDLTHFERHAVRVKLGVEF
ncbi:hypothetical protein [Methylobacterium nonmethylotrophicum]|uniref:Uncharacterized protein n=1 Tax=Methylobacterium nonmethylotrophicum TaxID=1141884 RepID=A0A4Z0NU64_9HYPH|nr:hypothetical protein [Methylobacterium nonmethylotrophicum]TGE00581.1 hypothetical protein EU555_07465 [Methylobacterium nonmethylotrophicum]